MRPNGLMLIQLPRAGWSVHCAVRRRKRCPTSLKIRSLSSQAVPKGLGWLRQSYSPRRGICLYHGPSPEGTRRGREGNRHQRCGTWDVLQDEATRDESQSGSPVFWRDVSCVARSAFYQYSIGDLQYAPEWRVRTEPERPRPQTGRTV